MGLGLDHTRVLGWSVRAANGLLDDAKLGPDMPVHALRDWERAEIIALAEQRSKVDPGYGRHAHRSYTIPLAAGHRTTPHHTALSLVALVRAGAHFINGKLVDIQPSTRESNSDIRRLAAA